MLREILSAIGYHRVMAHDYDQVVRLTSVRTELQAGVIVGGLEERGIQATMSGVYTANFRTEAPGWVEVLVSEHDLPQAKAVLKEVRDEHGDLDWSLVDVGEPEEADASGPYSWFAVFRRVCLVLVIAYLIWLGIGLTADMLRIADDIAK
jgi:hypothetical protein